MSGSRQYTLAGGIEEPQILQAHMATKVDSGEMLGAALHPTTQAFWDFDAMGLSVESANIGRRWQEEQQIRVATKEEETSNDTSDYLRKDALSDMAEERQEKMAEMREINGYQFTDADFNETLQDIIDDKEAFQAKHGLTNEEADRAEFHALAMIGMSPEEQEAYRQNLLKTEPNVANAMFEDADENNVGGRDHSRDPTLTASENQSLRHNEIMAQLKTDNPEVFDAAIKDAAENYQANRQTTLSKTVTTGEFPLDQSNVEIFTAEVAGTGANAQSFILDEAAPVETIKKAPEPFVLDMG